MNRANKFQKFIKLLLLERYFWQRACHFDGVQVEESFIIFSPRNRWADLNNRARLLLVRMEV